MDRKTGADRNSGGVGFAKMCFPVGRGRGRLKKLKHGRKKQVLEAVTERDMELPMAPVVCPFDEEDIDIVCVLDEARFMREVGVNYGIVFHESDETVLRACMDHLRLSHMRKYGRSS